MPKPLGSGAGIVPSLLVREVLIKGLVELASDDVRLSELYQRFDDLRDGTQDQWTQDLKDHLKRLVSYGSAGAVRVGVTYPRTELSLPWVSVLVASGSEDVGQATMGDVMHRRVEKLGAGEKLRHVEHTIIGSDQTTQIQIGSWAIAPEGSLLLHEAVRNVLMRDKGRLQSAGVLNITLSDGGFEVSSDLTPHVAYVPVMSMSMEWTQHQTSQRERVAFKMSQSVTYSN